MQSTTIVTGAGSGIGAQVARTLLENGGQVVATDLHPDGLLALEQEYPKTQLVTIAADISCERTSERALAAALNSFGSINGLVNCAGICGTPKPFDQISLEDFKRTLDVNLTGSFLMMRTIVPKLREAGGGSVVNISSIVGRRPSAFLADYGASKFGIVSLTMTIALEEAANQIRVNAICPGVIETAMQQRLKSSFEEAGAPFDLSKIPMGRFGTTTDVAELALWLLGDSSRYVTGQAISVDGAYSLT